MAASTTARLCSASMRDPNAFVPKPTVETIRPLLPRGRYVMSLTVVKLAGGGRPGGSGAGWRGPGCAGRRRALTVAGLPVVTAERWALCGFAATRTITSATPRRLGRVGGGG